MLYRDISFVQGGCLDSCGAIPTITGNNFKAAELGLSLESSNGKYISYDNQILPNGAFSVVIWARLRYTHVIGVDTANIISIAPSSNKTISLSHSDVVGRPLLAVGTTNFRYFNYVPNKKWHCWIFTIPGAGVDDIDNSALYVDAVSKSTVSTAKTSAQWVRSAFSYIGSGNSATSGLMTARIKVYDTVIDAAQILREQEEFEQARALTRMSRCSIPQANGSTITLLENWKYHGVGNPPTKRGEFIRSTGAYSVRQLTADNGFKKKGQFYLRCDTAGVIGIPSSAASGKWTIEWLKGGESNTFNLYLINNSISIYPATNSYFLQARDGEQITFRKLNGSTATTIIDSVAAYITNNTFYKTTIYRLGSSAGKFPKYLIPAETIYPAWTFLITIQGGIFTTETVVSVVGGSGVNPVTDSTYQTSKYFCIDADAGDFIGDIKHETSW